jgi:hypothetical protein
MSKSTVGHVVMATPPLVVTSLALAQHHPVSSGLLGGSTAGATIPVLTAPTEEPT